MLIGQEVFASFWSPADHRLRSDCNIKAGLFRKTNRRLIIKITKFNDIEDVTARQARQCRDFAVRLAAKAASDEGAVLIDANVRIAVLTVFWIIGIRRAVETGRWLRGRIRVIYRESQRRWRIDIQDQIPVFREFVAIPTVVELAVAADLECCADRHVCIYR